MRDKLLRLLLAGSLALTGAVGLACDEEDRKDVEEVGNEIDQEVDQLDGDGKDD